MAKVVPALSQSGSHAGLEVTPVHVDQGSNLFAGLPVFQSNNTDLDQTKPHFCATSNAQRVQQTNERYNGGNFVAKTTRGFGALLGVAVDTFQNPDLSKGSKPYGAGLSAIATRGVVTVAVTHEDLKDIFVGDMVYVNPRFQKDKYGHFDCKSGKIVRAPVNTSGSRVATEAGDNGTAFPRSVGHQYPLGKVYRIGTAQIDVLLCQAAPVVTAGSTPDGPSEGRPVDAGTTPIVISSVPIAATHGAVDGPDAMAVDGPERAREERAAQKAAKRRKKNAVSTPN